MAQFVSSSVIESLEARQLLSVMPADSLPAAPGELAGVSRPGNFIRIAFTDNSVDETDFVIERAGAPFGAVSTPFYEVGTAPASPGSGGRVFFRDRSAYGDDFAYRVRARNDAGVSDPSNLVFLSGFSGPPISNPIVYGYDERFFTGPPVVLSFDSYTDVSFGAGSPSPRIDPDTFSGTWEAILRAEFTETYTFHTASADGIALRVVDTRDGRIVLDFDNLQAVRDMPASGYQDVAGTAHLERGVFYVVQVRFSENAGDAGYRVGWSSFSTPLEPLPRDIMTPIAPGGPKVAGVWVGGAEWTTTFRRALERRELGREPYGFLATRTEPPEELSWTNVDRISVGFDRRVAVEAEDLSVRGADGTEYRPTGVVFDPIAGIATWALDRPLGPGEVVLSLASPSVRGLHDGGQTLDGEWPGAESFGQRRSGDGLPGGDFRYVLDVLPGDATHDRAVNALDLAEVKRRLGRTSLQRDYTHIADVNADGVINALDIAAVRRSLGSRLPAAPASLTAPLPALDPLPIIRATDDLFGSKPVLPV